MVVGAGLGGLAVALRLQSAGCEVTVVERLDRPGGRAGVARAGAYRWDTGPTLVTMPELVRETLAAGGVDPDALGMLPVDPIYTIEWADGARLSFPRGRENLLAEVERSWPAEVAGVARLLDKLEPLYRLLLEVADRPFASVFDQLALVPRLARHAGLVPLWSLVAKHVRDRHLRDALAFHPLFIGGDPFRVPAVYGGLVPLQLESGGWYPDGGVWSLVGTLAAPLEIEFGARCARIVRASSGAVRAVELDGGGRIACDAVVWNGDPYAVERALGRRRERRGRSRLARPSMSCLLFYFGFARRLPRLAHHHLWVGGELRPFVSWATARQSARRPRSDRGRRRPSPAIAMYVHAPARSDPSVAPPGGDALAVLVPVPNLGAAARFGYSIGELREQVLAALERISGLSDLREWLEVEEVFTPFDFRDRYDAYAGNAFALEPTLFGSGWFRRHNRDRRVPGLYHVGAGAHPGAGIPGVLLGARLTARLLTADLRQRGLLGPTGAGKNAAEGARR
ncbi:phytoene desaturase [Thermoleophilum album]|nr:phytoene desaturase [Thermoleophilum album]